MGAEKNMLEAERWVETARGDLKTARVLLPGQRYAHACFHAQQAVEKAVKALWYAIGGDPWGHSVQQLISRTGEIDAAVNKEITSLARDGAILDRFYIPTRYPNGLPDVTPDQAYVEEDAQLAIDTADRIVRRMSELIGKR